MELKKEIVKVITRKLNMAHYRVFIFGSRAAGRADIRSDIDVGIESGEPISLAILNDIKSELDVIPILQKVDVVDFSTLSPDFKEAALQNIEVLYEK